MLQFLLQLISTPITDPYIQKKWASPTAQVEWVIRTEAEKAGVNYQEALSVAKCESGLDPKAQNKSSTAKGIYQWLDGSYAYVGGKDPFDVEENVRLFMKYYPTNKGWWSECL